MSNPPYYYGSLGAPNTTSTTEFQGLMNYYEPPPTKKKTSNWVKFGIPLALIIIAGAVVGGIFGSRKSRSSSNNSPAGAASSAASVKAQIGEFPTATNSFYGVPLYPSTTNSAAFSTPTFVQTSASSLAWPHDPFQPQNPSVLSVRPDRPRLIAPGYKWGSLQTLIANDPYLKNWNATIFQNATAYRSLPPVAYFMDGSSGILDNARETKMRIKAFAYAYRMSNDSAWLNRAWEEVQNAAGNGTNPFGPAHDKWNSAHFLDVAEFTAAFAIAYDWLYDAWSDDQRGQILSTIITYGLTFGNIAYTPALDTNTTGWWTTKTTGNWNCVCNGGLTMGALAILGDDYSGLATSLLGLTVDNAKQNCAFATSSDGTWAETANYWYFGTTGHAEMSSALITATGSDYGLTTTNQNSNKSGLYHLYAYGPTSLFDYGDHGPNKFSTTANSMFYYATTYQIPQYALYQRDRHDAAEPWSMFWYDPTVTGAWWDGMPLDHSFDDQSDQWVSMRSSWTDFNALSVAMKAGQNQGHQTHNDLDAGDFVLDALGTRWAGELGSGDYNSQGYFSGDSQNSTRWLYYRKRTEGQNTIVVGQQNQNVAGAPSVMYSSSGTAQSSSTVLQVPQDSTAYWIADLTSAYFTVTSFKRGVRMINGRKQVLIQDEINASGAIQWRMHTNATVTTSGTKATLKLAGQTMGVEILNPPSGATFTTTSATRYTSDPATPSGNPDQPNPGVTVLVINLPEGTQNLQVLFTPWWSGSMPSLPTPPNVPLSGWTLQSH